MLLYLSAYCGYTVGLAVAQAADTLHNHVVKIFIVCLESVVAVVLFNVSCRIVFYTTDLQTPTTAFIWYTNSCVYYHII